MTGLPDRLRTEWWLAAGAFAVTALAVAVAVADAFGVGAAWRWAAVAGVPLAYLLAFARGRLALNRRPEPTATADGGQPVFRTLGLPNAVTVGRGWLYAALAGFVVVVPPAGSAWRWLPVAWYGAGVTMDFVDGLLARRLGRETVLGAKLDMAVDTLGFLVAPLVAVAWGRLPVWYLSLSAARYAFKFGCWTRRRRSLPVGDLPESRVRRPLAAVQMVFLTVAFLPVVPERAVWLAAPVVLVPSLAVFVRDYLFVAGYLGEDNAQADSRP